MGTTPNYALPYPESTDFVADGATAIENLADDIDSKLAPISFFIPAAQFSLGLGTTTLAVRGGWSNVAQAWQFPDGGNEFVVTSFYVPRSGNINMRVYYQGGGSGNFVLNVDSAGGRTPGAPGDTMYTLSGYNQSLVTPSYNGLAFAGYSTNIPVDLGDLVNIAVGRAGGNASDTSTNTCDFFGAYVLYV